MRRAPLVPVACAAVLILCAPAATALSFGRTLTATTLGQRLDFTAHLVVDASETIAPQCVAADVMFGDRALAAGNVVAALETTRGTGERRVRVTTRSVVDEPVVTIDVGVGCTSRVSRRFVAFVDPPHLRLASVRPDDALPSQRLDPQYDTLADIVRAADASRRRAEGEDGAAPRGSARDARRAAARATTAARLPASPEARAAAVRAPPGATVTPKPSRPPASTGREPVLAGSGPRLRLEAAALPAARVASRAGARAAPQDTALAAAAAAATADTAAMAVADAASAAIEVERARVRELEVGLARVRAEAQAQQRTVGALQARLREAEAGQYANGLVYALAAAAVFCSLLAAAFWALRPRQRRRARWFDAQAQQHRRAAPAAPPPAVAAAEERQREEAPTTSHWGGSGHGMLQVTAPASIGGLEVTTVLAPQSHYARRAEIAASTNAARPAGDSRPSSSMEELIDLEQQAEFYVVLGQEDAAIALLDAHLHRSAGATPLPYLQLLEMHRRRGDRGAYEAVRRSYEEAFDDRAPEWSADLNQGRSLSEYPQTIARLQALWPTPMHAMHSLDSLLLRPGATDDAFDYPAYRELLFLYSVARDLAGNVETDFGSIDLLLPLEDASNEPMPSPGGAFTVDLDVSGWPEDSDPKGLVIQRSVGRRGAG